MPRKVQKRPAPSKVLLMRIEEARIEMSGDILPVLAKYFGRVFGMSWCETDSFLKLHLS